MTDGKGNEVIEPGPTFPSATSVLEEVAIFAEQERLHCDAKWAQQLSGFHTEHPERIPRQFGLARNWIAYQHPQTSADPAFFTPKIANGTLSGLCLFRPMTEGTPGFVSTAYLSTFIDNVFGNNARTHRMGGVTLRLECNFDHPVPMLMQQDESSDQVKSVGFIPDFNVHFSHVEERKVFMSGTINGPKVSQRILPSAEAAAASEVAQPEQMQYAHCSALFFNQTTSKKHLQTRTFPLVFPPDMIERSIVNMDKFREIYNSTLIDYNDELKKKGQNYPVCQSDLVNAWQSHDASRKMFVPVDWVDAMQKDSKQWQHVTDQVYNRTAVPGSTGPLSCHIVRHNAALRPRYFRCVRAPFEFDAVYQATCWTMGPPRSVHGGCSLTCHEDAVHAFVLLHGNMLVNHATHAGMAGSPSALQHMSETAVVMHSKHIAINYRKMTPMDCTYRIHVCCTGLAPISTKEIPVLAFSTELRSMLDAETPNLLHTDGTVHVAVSMLPTNAAL